MALHEYRVPINVKGDFRFAHMYISYVSFVYYSPLSSSTVMPYCAILGKEVNGQIYLSEVIKRMQDFFPNGKQKVIHKCKPNEPLYYFLQGSKVGLNFPLSKLYH